MSTVLTIKQGVGMGDGAVLPALGPVTLKSVFPPRSFVRKSDGTPGTVQDAELSQDGVDVRASFWDCPDLSGLRGQTKVLHSVKAGNGRLSGVSVKVGKDKDKNNRWEIHVSKSALILDPEAANVTTQAQANGLTPALIAALGNTPAEPLPGSFADKAKEVEARAAEVKKIVQQFTPAGKPTFEDIDALFTHCYNRARKIVPESGDGAGLQAVQAAAATLFIASTNQGLLNGAAQRYQKTDNPDLPA